MRITVIGGGNGGQAMAGHFTLLGHEVTLYSRDPAKLGTVAKTATIKLKGRIAGTAKLKAITGNMAHAVENAELVMVTTTADAHKQVAEAIAPFAKEGQVIVLNPGRTLGAVEFSYELKKHTSKRVYIAEAQSLIYACRAETPGMVKIIGVKNKILLAAYPSSDTGHVLAAVNSVFDCFIKAENVLVSSLENVGAILHPTIVLFNAEAIERGDKFYFYSDITPTVAAFIEAIDAERCHIGEAYGLRLRSVSEWVSFAYTGIQGHTLYEKIIENPAYSKILAPTTLKSRYIYEELPAGIVPMIELGRLAKVDTPLMKALLDIFQVMAKQDFKSKGRTLANLGIQEADITDFLRRLTNG